MTAGQLFTWRQTYDTAPIIPRALDAHPVEWRRCFTSDLPRAFQTATAFHAGALTATPLLREPEFAAFRTGNLTLPFWIWRWVLRLSWMTGHSSQRANRDAFKLRVQAFLRELLEGNDSHLDTLVVSHAGIMAYLRRELLRRGFEGPVFKLAEHARLYVFERK